jgi:osmotically-inducible protein OsmY
MTKDRQDRSQQDDRSRQQNEALKLAVAERLEDSGHLWLRGINVEVDNQHVILSGTVPSYYMKQLAQETVRDTCPNRQLTNALSVNENPE